MILVAIVAILAIGGGYAVGGRVRNLERLRLRWWPLAPIGFAMQLAPVPVAGEGGDAIAIGLLIASYVLLIAFCILNLRTAGFPVMLVGLALNMLVISANGGMPVGREALEASGQEALLQDLVEGEGAKHHLEGEGDVLTFLADVIPVPPPVRQVISVGDIVVYLGVIWLVADGMRHSARIPGGGRGGGAGPRTPRRDRAGL